MMSVWRGGVLLLTGASVSVFGQVAKNVQQAEQMVEQTQQQMQQQMQYERDALLRRSPSVVGQSIVVDKIKPADTNAARDGCHFVRKIMLQGAEHLLYREQDELTMPYLGKCLDAKDLERLLSDLTREYVRRGYITTRAYLPPQDLSNGELIISVVVGRIGNFVVEGGGASNVNVGTTFPRQAGHLLDLRDLEQGIDQINSLGSNSATLDILPGQAEGESIVVIRNAASSPLHAGLTYDNWGQSATGRSQLGASFGWDNPLGLGEALRLSHQQSLPKNRGSAYSTMDSTGYVVPYGYNTISLGYQRSTYARQQVLPSGFALLAEGISQNAFVQLDRVILRNQSLRMNLSATLSRKSAQNFFAGQLLSVSSPTLTVLDVDQVTTAQLGENTLTAGVGVSRGLPLMGASRDGEQTSSLYPHAQFRKLRGTLSVSVPFSIRGYRGSWTARLVGQRAFDVLYSSEQLSVGGLYTVRGFINSTLSGENGMYLRNDLALQMPVSLGGVAAFFRPYLAFDAGHVSQRFPGAAPEGTLTGMAIGLTFGVGKGSCDLMYSRPLTMPGGLARERGAVYLRMLVAL